MRAPHEEVMTAPGWLRICRAHFRPFFFYLFGGIALGTGVLLSSPSAAKVFPRFFLLGLLLWPALEYGFHRGLHARARSARLRAFLHRAHGIHHEAPHRIESLFIRFSASASLSLLFFLFFWGAFGSGTKAVTSLLGLWGGYLFYEFAHYSAHCGRPRTAWMRYMRRHHRLHHHRDERARFGVTTPLMDWLFGTRGESCAPKERKHSLLSPTASDKLP